MSLRSVGVKTFLVRSMIVLFGLVSLWMVGTIFLFAGKPDPDERLRNLASRVEKKPTALNVRALLVEQSDGVFSYLHMALVGRAFARHPDRFRGMAMKLADGPEREQVETLARFGVGVFEYYPELQPEGFEKVYARADWLERFRAGKYHRTRIVEEN